MSNYRDFLCKMEIPSGEGVTSTHRAHVAAKALDFLVKHERRAGALPDPESDDFIKNTKRPFDEVFPHAGELDVAEDTAECALAIYRALAMRADLDYEMSVKKMSWGVRDGNEGEIRWDAHIWVEATGEGGWVSLSQAIAIASALQEHYGVGPVGFVSYEYGGDGMSTYGVLVKPGTTDVEWHEMEQIVELAVKEYEKEQAGEESAPAA